MKKIKDYSLSTYILGGAFVLGLIIGEVLCIIKAIRCNWEPVGKAEVIYTVGACTGLGGIIGWIYIKDD